MTTNTATNLGEFDVGTSIRIIGTFHDLAGALANPTDGKLVVRDDLGAETTVLFASWANDSTGIFHYDFTIPNTPGRFVGWWHGSAGVLVGERFYFDVARPGVSSP